ncbi:MAG: hypothetical protein QOG05_817 [Streptosporangiaceae bacterium]|jgi:hypothetical protein|nr:hypothetical protein [Streptosporangiaceae bacterium]
MAARANTHPPAGMMWGFPATGEDVPPKTATAIVSENAEARISGLRASLALFAVLALIAVFFSRRIPTKQPGSADTR